MLNSSPSQSHLTLAKSIADGLLVDANVAMSNARPAENAPCETLAPAAAAPTTAVAADDEQLKKKKEKKSAKKKAARLRKAAGGKTKEAAAVRGDDDDSGDDAEVAVKLQAACTPPDEPAALPLYVSMSVLPFEFPILLRRHIL